MQIGEAFRNPDPGLQTPLRNPRSPVRNGGSSHRSGRQDLNLRISWPQTRRLARLGDVPRLQGFLPL